MTRAIVQRLSDESIVRLDHALTYVPRWLRPVHGLAMSVRRELWTERWHRDVLAELARRSRQAEATRGAT